MKTIKVVFPRDIIEYCTAIGEELEVSIKDTDMSKLEFSNIMVEGILIEDSSKMNYLKKGTSIPFRRKNKKYIALIFEHMNDRQ